MECWQVIARLRRLHTFLNERSGYQLVFFELFFVKDIVQFITEPVGEEVVYRVTSFNVFNFSETQS